MKQIQAVLADIDGTLIESGDLHEVDHDLKKAIREIRNYKINFVLASGRPYFEQEDFFKLITDDARPLPKEGVIYEASCVRLYESPEVHRSGGLTREQINEILAFAESQQLFGEMIPQENNERYEVTSGYVTPSFRKGGRTDEALLEKTFQRVKPALEERFPYLEVIMSSNAIDLGAKGITKALPTQKYSEVTGIPLEHIVAIGDSANDLPMLEVVGKAGGGVVYVGTKPEQEQMVRTYARHLILQQRGPAGTAEALRELIEQINIANLYCTFEMMSYIAH